MHLANEVRALAAEHDDVVLLDAARQLRAAATEPGQKRSANLFAHASTVKQYVLAAENEGPALAALLAAAADVDGHLPEGRHAAADALLDKCTGRNVSPRLVLAATSIKRRWAATGKLA